MELECAGPAARVVYVDCLVASLILAVVGSFITATVGATGLQVSRLLVMYCDGEGGCVFVEREYGPGRLVFVDCDDGWALVLLVPALMEDLAARVPFDVAKWL